MSATRVASNTVRWPLVPIRSAGAVIRGPGACTPTDAAASTWMPRTRTYAQRPHPYAPCPHLCHRPVLAPHVKS